MSVALVTGAGKRIGKALAVSLAHKGYDIALHVRTPDTHAEQVATDIRKIGRRAAVIPAELSDAAATARVIPQAAAALGPVSCLVNNASSFVYDELSDLEPERWRRQFDINLLAPALLAKSLAAQIGDCAGSRGTIVNMLDDRIAHPTASFLSYSLSKAGLETLTGILASALAPSIRVNAIAPGLTLPSGNQDQESFRAQHGNTPLGRGSTISAIEQALHYLLDNEAVTGQVLFVDGGKRLVDRSHDDQTMK